MKTVIAYSNHLGLACLSLKYTEGSKSRSFLIRTCPDKKMDYPRNQYLIHIKLFLTWLYNCRGKAHQ